MSRAYNESVEYIPENVLWEGIVWQDNIGYALVPGYSDYVVSTDGEVYSLKKETPRRMHQFHTNHGHCYVDLAQNGTRKRYLVHRLVADAFLNKPEGSEIVRHLDDDPDNNYLNNLKYGTYHDNRMDMVKNDHDYRKGVYCFELDKFYRTCRDAARDNEVNPASITLCCQGKIATCKGMHFCYEEDYEEKSRDRSWMTVKTNFKPLIAINEDGEEFYFESRLAAAEAINMAACYISTCIHTGGKIRGWRFREA